MKKTVIFAAIAALILASCAKNETFNKVSVIEDAVTFGAYSGRVQTKAGATDDMNLDALKEHGFGVFATYSGTDAYETLTAATNDFMNNQLVKYYDANGDGTTGWEYAPLKYWPNPTNGKDKDDQKVSFFAYAPYAEPTATETIGITGFSIDATTGHNLVHYGFSNNKNDHNVDLMWGYKTKDSSTNPATYTINNNLVRTANDVAFVFQHMLAKLGGSQEGTITDPTDPAYVANGLIIKANPTADPTTEYGIVGSSDFGGAKGTKITVSKIIVESAPEEDPVGTPVLDANGNPVVYATGIQTGKLDLYTGEFVLDGTAAPVQFIQTLTDDDAEITAGTADSRLADIIAEPTSAFASFAALPTGVTKTAVNVYKDESAPIILVPGTAPVVDVTITYFVRTYDEKLPAGYTEIPQTVWNRVKFPTIEKNKKYNLLMILGLNDVKLVATVEDWETGSTWVDANGNGVVDAGELTGNDQEIDLPENL